MKSLLKSLATVMLLSAGLPLGAVVITVTTTTDELNNDGDCSLREAIEAANLDASVDACAAGSGADRVVVPAGRYVMSLEGRLDETNATGDWDVLSDMTLVGDRSRPERVTLDGVQMDRLLDIAQGVVVTIEGLNLENGQPGSNGGGLLNRGTVTLNNVRVARNTAVKFGGGIDNIGVMTLVESTLENNQNLEIGGSGGGGGVFNSGTLTVIDSTITDNIAARGGGIYNLYDDLIVYNSTISGNDGLNGGGIFNIGTLKIAYATIAGNSARDAGGGLWNFGGTALITRSIVATNAAISKADDCQGSFTSLGYNLIESTANCEFASGVGDLLNGDARLDQLGDNDGPTLTHALLPGSPAIDLIPIEDCILGDDQRGALRPSGVGCDAGAYEEVVAPAQLPWR